MKVDLHFPRQILDSVVGGRSAIDIPRLEIQNLEQAHGFAKTYGYDLGDPVDLEEVWSFHRRTISFLREKVLEQGELIPEELSDPYKLKDPANLLMYASEATVKGNLRQNWSCAILRVMHALAHLEDDLFKVFTDQIRDTILRPFQSHLSSDPTAGIVLGHKSDTDQIKLKSFEIKPAKSDASAVMKLLAKPEATSMGILDKMGVRLVTRSMFDVFRVVRFLVDQHIISFPNVIPDQSRNNLYPVNLFLEAVNELRMTNSDPDPGDVDRLLQQKLSESLDRAEYKEKRNEFSGSNYRSIKFIARRLIEIDQPHHFHFFFPYEVQIMDYETYLKNLSGPEAHEQYKKRQREAVRRRVLSFLYKE
ncbi:MAG TPA: TIGR04552 family protein [Bdellovibrionales bacterium]|nr:TIGR04552 family protein [Bdellovibrionales bacterium]